MEKNNKVLIGVAITLTLGILWSFHLYYELDKHVKMINAVPENHETRIKDHEARIYNIEEFLKAAIEATKKQQESANK